MTDSMALKSFRFRAEREKDWQRLEDLIRKIESGSLSALTDDELVSLPALYRSTLSSLSVARETSLDQGVIEYLQSLCTRAYYMVYGTRSTFMERALHFFKTSWPQAMKAMWKETLVSAFLFFFAGLIAFVLVTNDMDWYHNFVPQSMMDNRTPAASTETLECTLYTNMETCDDYGENNGLSVFASFLFQHNARIAIFAFALGFAFGIPTIFLLMYNGLTLGAFVALFNSRGLGFEVGGWLLIHGVTELFAVILAGAAGLKIGRAMAFPGQRSRIAAASHAGQSAATAAFGVVLMLFCAALLEGFGRQLVNSDMIRYSIAAMTGIGWCLYFYWPRQSNLSEFEAPDHG